MKNWHVILYTSFIALFGSCSAAPSPEEPNRKMRVVSTTAMIDDLVRQVGRDRIERQVLIRGELNPHSYQLVKGDDEKLSRADVIFYNGLGLEHGPSLQRYLCLNKKAISLGEWLQDKEKDLILSFNGQLDPHIWMDISLWAKTVPVIVKELSNKDPAGKEFYEANGVELKSNMLATHESLLKKMRSVPDEKRYLVTSHDAFNYFARAYLAIEGELSNNLWEERIAAPEGLAPESQLSATDIQLIIDYLRLHKVNVIFPESNVSRDSLRKICQAGRGKGLEVVIAPASLYADAMGKPGSHGDTYLKMISHNVELIAQYLDGKYPKDHHTIQSVP